MRFYSSRHKLPWLRYSLNLHMNLSFFFLRKHLSWKSLFKEKCHVKRTLVEFYWYSCVSKRSLKNIFGKHTHVRHDRFCSNNTIPDQGSGRWGKKFKFKWSLLFMRCAFYLQRGFCIASEVRSALVIIILSLF